MQNKSVLGACVLGVGGDEIINGFTNLMYAKPYTIFRDAVHIHPTVTELIPTMLKNLKPYTNTILITKLYGYLRSNSLLFYGGLFGVFSFSCLFALTF
jgi:hypothetical protein